MKQIYFVMSLAVGLMTGWATGALAQGGIRGSVYEDLNRNGRRDPGEPGIRGVARWVSVGRSHLAGTG